MLELLVVIGIIGILAAVVLIAINPSRQFAAARDTQRRSDLYSLSNAVYQYAAENDGDIPTIITTNPVDIGTNPGLVNLGAVLVPTFLPVMPSDPSTGDSQDTDYTIFLDGSGRVVATAASELNPGQEISVRR